MAHRPRPCADRRARLRHRRHRRVPHHRPPAREQHRRLAARPGPGRRNPRGEPWPPRGWPDQPGSVSRPVSAARRGAAGRGRPGHRGGRLGRSVHPRRAQSCRSARRTSPSPATAGSPTCAPSRSTARTTACSPFRGSTAARCSPHARSTRPRASSRRSGSSCSLLSLVGDRRRRAPRLGVRPTPRPPDRAPAGHGRAHRPHPGSRSADPRDRRR